MCPVCVTGEWLLKMHPGRPAGRQIQSGLLDPPGAKKGGFWGLQTLEWPNYSGFSRAFLGVPGGGPRGQKGGFWGVFGGGSKRG